MSFDEIDYDSMDEDDIKLPANLLDQAVDEDTLHL